MTRNKLLSRSVGFISIASFISLGAASIASADPLPGETLKFQQLPLGDLVTNPKTPAPGHDVPSTATISPGETFYEGSGAADDFSDNVTSPIVDVQWWGSYLNGNGTLGSAQQFLISIESDVPAGPAGGFSQPGAVLSAQVVNAGALAPQSGTFTETTVASSLPGPDGKLYQYNAELANPFPEQAGTIYWLKIVALDNTAQGAYLWGWHNRDYTITDPLAAPQTPGETNLGSASNPIWHFQDDAVESVVQYTPGGIPIESQFTPLDYNTTTDGFGTGIAPPSEDLAFSLYYSNVPEPVGLPLLSMGFFLFRRCRRRT